MRHLEMQLQICGLQASDLTQHLGMTLSVHTVSMSLGAWSVCRGQQQAPAGTWTEEKGEGL